MKIKLIFMMLLGVSTIIQPLSLPKFSLLGNRSKPSPQGPTIVDYNKAKHFMYLAALYMYHEKEHLKVKVD